MVSGRSVQWVLPTFSSTKNATKDADYVGGSKKGIAPGTLVSRALSRSKAGVITPALKEQARSLSNMLVHSTSINLYGSQQVDRNRTLEPTRATNFQKTLPTKKNLKKQRSSSLSRPSSSLSSSSSNTQRKKYVLKSPNKVLTRQVEGSSAEETSESLGSFPASFSWSKIPQTEDEAIDFVKIPWFVDSDILTLSNDIGPEPNSVFADAIPRGKSYDELRPKVRNLISILVMYSESHRVAKHGFRALYIYCGNDDVKKIVSEMGNGIPCIVKIMGRHSDNADVQKNGCALLSQLASPKLLDEAFVEEDFAPPQEDQKERVAKIVEAGGIDAVVSAMHNHRTNLNVQLQACWAASRMGMGGGLDVVSLLILGGLIEILVDSMMHHREDVGLQFVGCVVLRGLSEELEKSLGATKKKIVRQHIDDDSTLFESDHSEKYEPTTTTNPMAIAIIESGGLSAITDAMELHDKEELVLSNGIWAISALCAYDTAIRSTFVHTNGILSIIEAVQNNPVAPVAEASMTALTNITKNGKYLHATMQAGSLNIVVPLMEEHQDIPEVQEAGCNFLTHLAPYQCPKDFFTVRSAGGVGAALNAMRIHEHDPNVQAAACTCLWALAFDAPSRIRIANAGGLAAVLNAMRQHTHNGIVQEKACGCLSNLVITEENRSAIASAGGFDTILVAMKIHLKNEKVLGKALRVLRNIAVDSAYRVPIRCAGGLVMITRLMRIYPNNARIQEQSCDALRFLTYDVNSNVDSLLKLDCRNLLKKAAEKFPLQCRSSARTIIRKLDTIQLSNE